MNTLTTVVAVLLLLFVLASFVLPRVAGDRLPEWMKKGLKLGRPYSIGGAVLGLLFAFRRRPPPVEPDVVAPPEHPTPGERAASSGATAVEAESRAKEAGARVVEARERGHEGSSVDDLVSGFNKHGGDR